MKTVLCAFFFIVIVFGVKLVTAQQEVFESSQASADSMSSPRLDLRNELQAWQWRPQLLFYGDNTEFFNRFREGETQLGAAGFLTLERSLSATVSLNAGLFFHNMVPFTQQSAQVSPMLRFSWKTSSQKLLFGTLDTQPFVPRLYSRVDLLRGPDNESPHRILPPLKQEQHAFSNLHESGIQWFINEKRWFQESWLNWQRLNTPQHRERFDIGLLGEVALWQEPTTIALGYQAHVAHEGGQLFASGPVKDSLAAGPGLLLRHSPTLLFDHMGLESYYLRSFHIPDRSSPEQDLLGWGWFTRLSATRGPLRTHLIFWRSAKWLKDEGDANYGSQIYENLHLVSGPLNYIEAGGTYNLLKQNGFSLDFSIRNHYIDQQLEYSYRLIARYIPN